MKILSIIALLLLSSPAFGQTTLSFPNYVNSLPSASSINSSDALYILQSGTSKKLPGSLLSSLNGNNSWSGTNTFVTQVFGTNNTTVATTAFVQSALGGTNAITALTGDLTANGPGSVVSTLATVNLNVGTFGSSSTIPTFTVNGKGLITAASSVTPSLAASNITSGILSSSLMPGLTGDVTSSAGTVATTISAGVVTGSKIAASTVTNSNLAVMAPLTFKGNSDPVNTTNPTDVEPDVATTMLQYASEVSPDLGFSFDRSVQLKLGDWISVMDLDASGSIQTTTGSISATSTTLTLTSAIDFFGNGEIRVDHAGTAFTASPPTAASVTPQGTPGSTHYSYQISSLDGSGGVGAAITAFTTTTGNATLTGTNYNKLTWTAGAGANGYAVWRTSPNPAFLGVIITSPFNDMGQTAPVTPDWIPSSPPGSSLADWLITFISSGAGTTTLILGDAAITTATNVTVAHDDSFAFQATVDYLAYGPSGVGNFGPGGTVLVPAGQYPIGNCFTVPTDGSPVFIMGSGNGGDSPTLGGTRLIAQGMQSCVIFYATNFARGYGISNLTIDGNAQAFTDIDIGQVDASVFENLFLLNATLANLRIGNGSTNTQENKFNNIKLDNSLNVSTLSGTQGANGFIFLPFENIKNNGINNDFVNIKASNAQTANIHSTSTAAGNKYVNVHGYNFFAGASQASSTNNILIEGSEEQIVACEMDGAGTANMQINGFLNSVTGCYSQFDGITAQIGIQFGTGTNGNVVNGNIFANSTLANTIVQAGTAGTGGNLFCNNWNNTSSASTPCRSFVPVAFSSLPSCNAGNEGMLAAIKDLNTTVTFNATVTVGGGSTHILVYCNGSNWVQGG